MSNRWHYLFSWLIWSSLYILAGLISIEINNAYIAIDSVWLPSGVMVVALIKRPKSEWLPYLITFFIINQLLIHNETNNIHYVVNIFLFISPLLIALVIHSSQWQSKLDSFMFWTLTIILVYAIEEVITLTLFTFLDIQEGVRFYFSSWIANVSSVLYTAIMLSGFTQIKRTQKPISSTNLIWGLLGVGLLILSSWIIFAEPFPSLKRFPLFESHPSTYFLLAFIPILFVIVVTLTLKTLGRALSLLLLGAIVIYCTYQGLGAFFLTGLKKFESVIIAQSYLSSIAMVTLFISILVNEAPRLLARHSLVNSSLLRYQFYPEEERFVFDPEIKALLHLPATLSLNELLNAIDEKDRQRIQGHWQSKMDTIDDYSTTDFLFRTRLNHCFKIQDKILMVIQDESQYCLLGEWEIVALSSDKGAQCCR